MKYFQVLTLLQLQNLTDLFSKAKEAEKDKITANQMALNTKYSLN